MIIVVLLCIDSILDLILTQHYQDGLKKNNCQLTAIKN